jgi:hypothetical protein
MMTSGACRLLGPPSVARVFYIGQSGPIEYLGGREQIRQDLVENVLAIGV